ncbi:MAG: carboxypeptidase regulatory-like domain-containing protein [Halobacteriaceae archaeon]
MARRLPPLVQLFMETITLRDLLLNRFMLLVVVIVVASAGTVAFVDANDGGEFTGEVVTADGEPVADATVVLRKIPLQGVVKTERTTTDADGEFRFTGQDQLLEYRVVVRVDNTTVASKSGHLMFRGQNEHVVVVVEESELPA